MMKNKKTVVVGMSGGVDSSAAAYLLKQQGYDVIGVTMQIWQQEDTCTIEHEGGCCGLSAVEDARRVANQIGIPYYVMNFREEFQENVIDYFVKEYRAGRTPNPCIACNRYVKWESLLQKSLAIGADYIATGHYAKIVQLENGRYTLIRSDAKGKDQTYALYNLTQNQLSHTLFPIGSYEKPQIRAIAEKAGLQVAHKPDSQEICFVPDNDYAGFIERETNEVEKPGNFVSTSGEILGTHKGIGHYTIGQRKGLGIAFGEPMFVVEICPETNEVVLGKNDEVFTDWLKANQVNHMAVDHFEVGQKVTARIRYNHGGAKAVISEVTEDSFSLTRPEIFKTQLRALYRASAYGNIAIMYPMITSVWEVKRIKEIADEVRKELDEQGILYGNPEQGIMIETPAAVMISDELAKEVDFFSIGTNDLTQYTLAIDRQNTELDMFYDSHHPAVLKMISMVIDNAHKAGIWAGICGELGADQSLTKEFLAMGVDELSVSPGSVLPIRKIVVEHKAERGDDDQAARHRFTVPWLQPVICKILSNPSPVQGQAHTPGLRIPILHNER